MTQTREKLEAACGVYIEVYKETGDMDKANSMAHTYLTSLNYGEMMTRDQELEDLELSESENKLAFQGEELSDLSRGN